MTSCTYRFKNASGEEVTITGQAEMKAFLADGGLEQLLPGKVLPWKGAGKASIEDFGAKLAGARKDMQASISKEWSDDEIASQPFSKVWPAADIDAIEDPFEASVMFAAREEIPAKPRVAYKVKAWVAKVKMFRELVSRVIGKVGRERFLDGMKEYGGLDGFRAKVMLLEAIDRSQWKRIGRVDEYPDAYTFNDDGTKTKTPQVVVEIDGRRERFEGSRNVLDALDKINEKLGTAADPKKMQFEVRGREGMYSINKKGDREYRKLKTFATTKEAFAYIKDNHDDLVAAWDGVKDRDNVGKGDVRNDTNRPRTGSDYRNGKDVTPEQFGDTFGFRGVQFGNWVSQGAGGKDRQGMLNQAYDALMDLANIVGVPPKAISLNGSLGLAFGSRGSGNASAHFEPGNLVINLTKTRGAGTLAHEWFHALDNYFSRQRGGEVKIGRGVGAQEAYRTQNYITYRPEPMYVHKSARTAPMSKARLEQMRADSPKSGFFAESNWQIDPSHPQGVRPEVERAFADLVEALDNSPMKARSAKNDKGEDGYWSRIIERGARSFENYVIHKMRMNGYDNDYLANVRQIDDFARDKDRYPYLIDGEIAPVAEAFDNLFAEIKTKETEQGVAMFRTDAETDESAVSRDTAESFVRQFVEEYPSAPEIILAENFSQLPADVQRDAIAQGSGPFKAKGAMKNGKIYVLRRNHQSMADMEATVFHEVLGHAGTRKLLGPKFSQELNKLFIGLGGYSGLEKIMAARGMSAQFHGYMDGVRQAKERNPDLWTDALAATVMTEEVFAHIAEQKGGKALRDRFMALVGMVRDWLRKHGFAELASIGESDILFMLQRARAGMREPSGIVRNGVRIAGGEVLAENGQVISVEGDRDFDALKVLAGRLGLTVDDGPTVFSNSLPESQKSGDDASMDDANNVSGKQAPTPSDTPDGAPALLRTINTASGRKTVRDHVAEAYSNVTGESAKTFNWWQRTVGSQYGKAKSDKDFGRVYDAAHAFLDGVSAFAKEASERASGILPHLDTWRDVAAGANVRKQWADSQDYQAIAPAIFDGTLANGTTGKVWTDDQLRDKYDLNDKQIGHYREFRAAVDFSLETLAASEMARLARASKMDAADRDMGMDDALSFYLKQLDPRIKAARNAVEGKGGEIVARHTEERAALEEAAAYLTKGAADLLRNEMRSRHDKEIDEVMGAERSLENLRASFTEKVEQIRKLQSEGYAPLMRFGQYTVDVVKLDDEGQPIQDEDGNPDRPFFGMFESEAEARKAEKILAEEYPGYTVTRGVLSTEANQLYRGLTPETAEMFARLLGTDENEAFQAYLKQAVANRSAMKRLINRMGVEGFATDVPRVLSAFITSNARLSSGNWYFGEMSKAVEAIPKHKGDVKTEAIQLMQYVQNPVEEAAGLRGFLFFSFLGGSIASALVNLTQTFTTTLPYLSQFGASDVAKALPKAMALSGKMMKKGLDAVSDKDLKDALRKASDEGVVDPQEIHLLMAEAGGNGASVGFSGLAGAMNKEWATPAARVTRSLSQAWGMLFGAAEKYNRHVAFIAAWEVAPKGVDRYEFAKNAVTETQFDYTKASRPNWARGAVGATLFTFKTFSINYVEFMSRLPPRERAIALGVLFLLAGMSGMPGGDDLDDVVDTVAQKMGYNWNNAAARHAWLVRVIGVGGADFVERGISSMLPLDVSARLGMGNLIPGTAVLQKSNASPARDVQEFFGPAGSVVAGFREVFDNAGGGKGVIESGLPLLPKMYRDVWQALDMVQTGQYRDTKGRKVVDVGGVDALLKGIGFQPNAVAEPRRIERMLAQSSGMQRIIRQDISELWARGVAEQDAQKIESARSILREWNEKNPDSRIVMNPTSIAQRVQAMRLTSAERLVKATPKDMRNALAAEMAIQQ